MGKLILLTLVLGGIITTGLYVNAQHQASLISGIVTAVLVVIELVIWSGGRAAGGIADGIGDAFDIFKIFD